MKRFAIKPIFIVLAVLSLIAVILISTSSPALGSNESEDAGITTNSSSASAPQAQQPGNPYAVDRLVIETGGEAKVSLSRTTGFAKFVRMPAGEAMPAFSANRASANSEADTFLAQHGDAFGISDAASELKLVSTKVDQYGSTHLTYQQMYGNVPVFAGTVKVHLNGNNGITAVNGAFIPGLKISQKAEISAAAAARIATNAVMRQKGLANASSDITAINQELVIFNDGLAQGIPGANHLVYYIEAANSAHTVREFLFVDAHNGTVVNQYTGIHETLDRKVSEASIANVIWEDSAGDPDPIPSGWAGGTTQQVTDWQNEIDGAAETYNVFASMTGGSYLSYDGADATMHTVNNDPGISCPNANWNGVSTNYCSGVTGDDTVAHEWGHAYTEKTNNLIYQWQSGALNESYSDIWGEVVDLLNGRGLDTPGGLRTAGSCSTFGQGSPSVDMSYRWLSGEDDPAFGGAIRDMWNPVCYGDPGKVTDTSQYVCSTVDSGGVHTNSGVPNHAFALMVDGGTYNGQTITGLGLTKAAHIHWQAQSVYLTQSSNFVDQADALENSCNDLLGVNLNALSTTSTGGVPSGEIISAADCAEVAEISLAVEFRTEPTFCNFQPMLDPNAPALCSVGETVDTIDLQDWESGIGGWSVGTHDVVMPSTFDTPNWAVVGGLPEGEPAGSTQAAFVGDLIIGDCSNDIEAGVLFLDSPSITIPAGVNTPRVAFDHWVATELGWDGGNLKVSVNSGAYQLVPSSAYDFNPYPQNLNTVGAGNDNPLAGQAAFTGTDGGTVNGSWGQSQVDLSSFANAGDNIVLRYDFGIDGCNGVIGWYVDNVHTYSCSTGGPTPTAPPPTATPPGPTQTPSPTPGGGTTFTFNPVADSVIRSTSPTKNFGTKSVLGVDDVPNMDSYLRFDVQGLSGAITSATLEMYVTTGSTTYDVHGVSDNSWGETTITFNNAPAIGALINGSGAVNAGIVVVDVTSYVTGSGLTSFALDIGGTGSTFFSSREGANPPKLVIQTGAGGPTPTPPPPTATPPGPTPTSPPPTPTPSGSNIHVGDLDGSSTLDRPTNSWQADVVITVHDSGEGVVANADVSGNWSTGDSGSCTTNGSGQCTVSLAGLVKANLSVDFTVTNVDNGVDVYDAGANHDPDADSDGTTITVPR